MASRAGNQGGGALNRRLSTNNPFRMSMVDSSSVSLSPRTSQDRIGSSSSSIDESRELQYTQAPYYSAGSSKVNSPLDGGFRKSASPSTNPFLEEVEDEFLNNPRNANGSSLYSTANSNPVTYPTAREEKQRLRDRYRETEDVNNGGYEDVDSDLPPSYEEVAGPLKAKNPHYPREKRGTPSAGGTSAAPRDPRVSGDREVGRHHRYSHYAGSVPPPRKDERFAPPLPKLATLESHRRYDRSREYNYPREHNYDQEYYSDKEYMDRERERERSYYHPPHRSHRHHHEHTPSSRDRKPKHLPKNVDTIDKMDVTALFGGSFHHDGPFDAVTPHRNKNAKAPPVMAFPADGPNNSIGGAPIKKNAMNEVFGRDELEDDDDIYQIKANPKTTVYGASSNPASTNGSTTTLEAIKPGGDSNITAFDPRGRVKTVEGPTTDGLGSTTFLDGAPASHKAIETDVRNHARQTRLAASGGGIQRTKSLSQRLAGSVKGSINGNNSNSNGGGYSRSLAPERPIALTRSHSGHLESGDDNEDVYLGLPSSDLSRKKSTGTKLMRRVRSMKVGRR